MQKIAIVSFILLGCFFPSLWGQGKDQLVVLKNLITDTIPFQLNEHNNIVIQAVLNKQDTLDLMFHTAANSMTLIKEVTQRLESLHLDHADSTQSWGGAQAARYSENNLLQIGGSSWDKVRIWENERSGPQTDGKFGPNLFENRVIEIHHDKKILVIHPALPATVEGLEKLSLIYENGFMFLEGKSRIGENEYHNRFLIHSGYGGTLLFDDQFVFDNKLGERLEVIDEKELRDAYGNVLKTKKAVLPSFMLGAANLTKVPVGFFEGAIGRQKMSVIGCDFLKRFNIIIDAKRSYIYLKANNLWSLPFTDI